MVKNIISYILSFIMVALIIAIVAVSFLQNKVLNEDYWKMQMEQNNYYEKLEDTVNDGFENYIMQSGMDSSVFEGIYDLDKVKEDTNSIVHAILNNEEFKIDTSTISEIISKEKSENLRKYIKDNKVLVNKTTENQIQNFENAIINSYANSVLYSNSIVKTVSSITGKVKDVIPKIFIMVVILLIVNIVALIILNIKNIRNVLKFIAIIAFTIAGLSILGIILEIQSLTVLNENISAIVQIFVKEIYRVLYTSTASGTVLGLLFSILCSNGSKNIAK